MPPPLIIAGNWKMNTTLREAQALARDVRALIGPEPPKATVVLCPPFPFLGPILRVVDGSPIQVGAQDLFYEEKGAFTGQVSAAMLKDLCAWVIVGHSERRQLFGETDDTVNKKVKAALAHGLRPILCVGETLAERQSGRAAEAVRRQVEAGLQGVDALAAVVVAYEPVWAIGTGVAATPETAREVMAGAILETLAAKYGGHAALETPLLYGGSVTAANVEGFAREDCIHGALVGGASLRALEFVQIVGAFPRAKGLGKI